MNLPTASLAKPDLPSRDFYSDPYPVYDYLRTHDPVHWSPQWGGWVAMRDMEFEGKQIEKGQFVGAILGAAIRDPEQFAHPSQLDVTRQNVRHWHSLRLGAPLARLEGEIAVRTLILRFSDMRLAKSTPACRQEIKIHGLKSPPVLFH